MKFTDDEKVLLKNIVKNLSNSLINAIDSKNKKDKVDLNFEIIETICKKRKSEIELTDEEKSKISNNTIVLTQALLYENPENYEKIFEFYFSNIQDILERI